MSDLDETEMAEALIAVQQAYSFLHDFHARLGDTVMQLVDVMKDRLGLELSFAKAQAMHTHHTSFRQNPFDRNSRWVWDWFPLYALHSFFETSGSEEFGTLVMEFSFQADKRWDGSRDIAPTLEGAGSGKTDLSLYIWYHPAPDQDWFSVWRESKYPDEKDIVTEAESGFKALHISIALTQLITTEAIRAEGESISKLISDNFSKKSQPAL